MIKNNQDELRHLFQHLSISAYQNKGCDSPFYCEVDPDHLSSRLFEDKGDLISEGIFNLIQLWNKDFSHFFEFGTKVKTPSEIKPPLKNVMSKSLDTLCA